MKRGVDVIVAGTLLIILAPVFAIVAGAVRLSGPGPVIYRGQRVGYRGQRFNMLKFRTMTAHPYIKAEITVHGDPRVTRLGRILRATKLDELPQLINVLRGEMSLVGPRPESPYYVSHYTQDQRAVLGVRPGITGLSQVLFRSEERLLTGLDPENYYVTTILPLKLAIDLDYVRNHSLKRDFSILALTIIALLRPAMHSPQPADSARKDRRARSDELARREA